MSNPAPTTFAALIGLWPKPCAAKLAHDLGLDPLLVRQWRRRRSIPARYWVDVEKAAAARGFDDVTVALLAGLTARKPGGGLPTLPFAGVRVPSGTSEPAGGTANLSLRGPASLFPGAKT